VSGRNDALLIGDEKAFATLVERHRGELRVHCYRMLGSLEDAEDLVQETFLRAWRHLAGFEGRSSVRSWLYRIATNACLNALDQRARRVLPHELAPPFDPHVELPPRTDIPWLQPFPDHLWEPAAPGDTRPDTAAVARETIELAFLAAIQRLPPRQRAVLILRDVLGWPASRTAELLDSSVASVNSASQRARATMREHLPPGRLDWAPPSRPTSEQWTVVRRYADAVERGDLDTVARLLAEDVRATMPPYPMWYQGRDAVLETLTTSWNADSRYYVGRFRLVLTQANGQPAAAGYVRGKGEPAFHAFAISVLRVEAGRIAELTAFHDTSLFPAFGLATELPMDR
jgi:RNA polymerase sigma-70 factor (ECF subfamily)